jgi:hypothetical protein
LTSADELMPIFLANSAAVMFSSLRYLSIALAMLMSILIFASPCAVRGSPGAEDASAVNVARLP